MRQLAFPRALLIASSASGRTQRPGRPAQRGPEKSANSVQSSPTVRRFRAIAASSSRALSSRTACIGPPVCRRCRIKGPARSAWPAQGQAPFGQVMGFRNSVFETRRKVESGPGSIVCIHAVFEGSKILVEGCRRLVVPVADCLTPPAARWRSAPISVHVDDPALIRRMHPMRTRRFDRPDG